jgi:hypothetical protein
LFISQQTTFHTSIKTRASILQSRSSQPSTSLSHTYLRILKPNQAKRLSPLSTANHTQCLPTPPSQSLLRSQEPLPSLRPPSRSRPSQLAPTARSTTLQPFAMLRENGMTAYDQRPSHTRDSAAWSISQTQHQTPASQGPGKTGPVTSTIKDGHHRHKVLEKIRSQIISSLPD